MRRQFVVRPWGRLAVWVYGGGPNRVLAIHGLAGSGRYWAGLSAALGPEYTVVAPDLRGLASRPSLGITSTAGVSTWRISRR